MHILLAWWGGKAALISVVIQRLSAIRVCLFKDGLEVEDHVLISLLPCIGDVLDATHEVGNERTVGVSLTGSEQEGVDAVCFAVCVPSDALQFQVGASVSVEGMLRRGEDVALAD